MTETNDSNLEPRPRLSARDAATVDAVLGAGFDPERPTADPRVARLTSLLGRLDQLPEAGAGVADPSLVDATIAGIDRFERERGRSDAASAAAPAAVGPTTLGPVLGGPVIGRIGPWRRTLQAAAVVLLAVAAGLVLGRGEGPMSNDARAMAAGVLSLPSLTMDDAERAIAANEPIAAPPGRLMPMGSSSQSMTGRLFAVPSRGTVPGEVRISIVFVGDGTRVPPSLEASGVRMLGRCRMLFGGRGG